LINVLKAELLYRKNTTDVITVGFFVKYYIASGCHPLFTYFLVISEYELDPYAVTDRYCKCTHPS
jgi:hypothetical protein